MTDIIFYSALAALVLMIMAAITLGDDGNDDGPGVL